MARLRAKADEHDWWRSWEWPVGLRDCDKPTDREELDQFWDARRKAAPRHWVLARLRRRRQLRRAEREGIYGTSIPADSLSTPPPS